MLLLQCMKTFTEGKKVLGNEERNLLSVAYKNVVGSRRSAWRVVSSIEQKHNSEEDKEQAAECKAYRVEIETELKDVCKEVLVSAKLVFFGGGGIFRGSLCCAFMYPFSCIFVWCALIRNCSMLTLMGFSAT